MPLIHETGAGVPNADSYVSVAEADAYHASRGNELWAPIPAERKEQLLRRASDYITGVYRNAWIGVAAYTGNLLAFPRNHTEPRHYGLYQLGVPQEVREVTAELALIANSQSLFPTQQRGKKRVKVGPLEVEYDALSPNQNTFVSASLKLTPYLKQRVNGFTARLIRT